MRHKMKLAISITLLLLSFIGQSQSTKVLYQEQTDAYDEAEKELNYVFTQILKEYKSDTLFIDNLKLSQKIWTTFRDAELNMKYPDREEGYYGSIHSYCIRSFLIEITKDRINTLKTWIEGIDEGDVCAGSVKLNISRN